jgi:hypothetical protein
MRRGRCSSSPAQFGQRLCNLFSTQSRQNVHSYEQIKASWLSAGSSCSQHSHFGRSSSMASSLVRCSGKAFGIFQKADTKRHANRPMLFFHRVKPLKRVVVLAEVCLAINGLSENLRCTSQIQAYYMRVEQAGDSTQGIHEGVWISAGCSAALNGELATRTISPQILPLQQASGRPGRALTRGADWQLRALVPAADYSGMLHGSRVKPCWLSRSRDCLSTSANCTGSL